MSAPHLQERFIVPNERRLLGSRSGDLLVSLSRGLAGKGRDPIEAARSLGFLRTGDQRLLCREDRSERGNVARIEHLVTVTEFRRTIDLRRPEDRILVRSGMLARQTWVHGQPVLGRNRVREFSGLYDNEGLRGNIERFAQGEYVHAEHQPNAGTSIMWSTDKPCSRAFGLARLVLGNPLDDEQKLLWLDVTGEEHEARTAKFLEGVPEAADTFAAAFAEFAPGLRFFWRRRFLKFSGSPQRHGEVAVLVSAAHTVDPELTRRMMGTTGTPLVAKFARREPAALEELMRDGAIEL